MANYNKLSPYHATSQTNGYLDIMSWKNFPAEVDDILFTVTKSYEHRPDLLAYDLYGDVGYWWVFAARNPETIQDPMFDLVSGTSIYLPKASTLKKSIG
jgi:hypothetical protein